MKPIKYRIFPAICVTITLALLCQAAKADTFGSDSNTFNIEFVPIGDPNNLADTEGFPFDSGSVPYAYRMGKFEISEQMIDKANALGGLGITKDTRGPDKPATSVSWFEAAQFVNWLNVSTSNSPAYKFDANGDFQLWEEGDLGYNPNNLFRNGLAKYVLPSSDEWYKAAYYDPATGVWNQFPVGAVSPISVASGTAPGTAVFLQSLVTGPADIMQGGGLSPYGTMAQGGNAFEWLETESDRVNDDPFLSRIRRGGFWESSASALSVTGIADSFPADSRFGNGFRVAIIPEPSTVLLLGLGSFCLLGRGKRSRILRSGD